MIRHLRFGRSFAASVATLVAGAMASACFSSAPPAPTPRTFDPLPATVDRSAHVGPDEVRVSTESVYGPEFAVRTAAREVRFDATNRWLAEPARLLAAAVARRLTHSLQDVSLELVLEVFELDVVAAPRAHVVVTARTATGWRLGVDRSAAATASTPEALTAAMAEALAAVGDEIDAWFGKLPGH